jgi:TPR repeat protein
MIEPDLCKFEADKEELEERKIDLYERACLVGNDADSCAKAAAMYDSGEVKAPNDRHIIELAARSCTAKPEHEFYCGDLMDYLERHSCGPVACTLAYANLCHSEVDPSRCLEAGRRVLGGIGAEIDIDRAYDLLLVGCRHFDAEACKVGKRTVKDARD